MVDGNDNGTGVIDPAAAGGAGAGGAAGDADGGGGSGAQEFDWSGSLPTNLPPELSKLAGKKWSDVTQSYRELQTLQTKTANELKSLQKSAGKPPKRGDEAASMSDERLREVFGIYNEAGELEPEVMQEMTEHFGISEDEVLDYMDYRRDRNRQFMDQAQEIAGEGIPITDVFAWLSAGQTPFGADELKWFNKQANRGKTSWVTGVVEAYMEAMAKQGGGTFVQQQQRQQAGAQRGGAAGGQQVPPHRGSAAGAGYSDGYKSYDDFKKDTRAAGNDMQKVRAVQAKLTRSDRRNWPEHARG